MEKMPDICCTMHLLSRTVALSQSNVRVLAVEAKMSASPQNSAELLVLWISVYFFIRVLRLVPKKFNKYDIITHIKR